MKLSVIVPAYRAAATLPALIASLQPQLDPTRELIVVDDASPQGVCDGFVEQENVRLIRHLTNRGVAAARNSGARAARGEYLLFLDADTIAAADLLDRVERFFAEHPDVDAASGLYQDDNGGETSFARYLDASEAAMRATACDAPAPGTFSGSLVAIRRRIFLRLGGFCENRNLALEDIEFGLRLTIAGHRSWLVSGWRVRHRQPSPWAYLRELVPRTRDYLLLLAHYGRPNEMMGGASEILARSVFFLAFLLAVLPAPTLLVAGVGMFAGWFNRGWLKEVWARGGLALLPSALFWHAATTLAAFSGGAWGLVRLCRQRFHRRLLDFGVVAAWLRTLFHPTASGYLIHFLTHRCPARCDHCFDHQRRLTIGKDQELSLPRIARLAKSAGPLLHVSLTGGEPLLRNDLPEIIRLWHRAGARSLSLSTSGAYPERLARLLATVLPQEPGLRLIVTLSLDGIGTAHDRLRHLPGLSEKLITCLALLTSARLLHPQLALHVCVTLSGVNGQEAEAAVHWARRWRPDQVELNVLRGTPSKKTLAPPSPAAYDRLRHLVAAANRRNRGLARLFSVLDRALFAIVRDWREPWPCGPCLAGRRLLVVLADGRVLPCETLADPKEARSRLGLPDAVLGDLRDHDDDLSALLRSHPARSLLTRIAAHPCRCSFECAIFATLVYRPWRLPFVWRTACSPIAREVSTETAT